MASFERCEVRSLMAFSRRKDELDFGSPESSNESSSSASSSSSSSVEDDSQDNGRAGRYIFRQRQNFPCYQMTHFCVPMGFLLPGIGLMAWDFALGGISSSGHGDGDMVAKHTRSMKESRLKDNTDTTRLRHGRGNASHSILADPPPSSFSGKSAGQSHYTAHHSDFDDVYQASGNPGPGPEALEKPSKISGEQRRAEIATCVLDTGQAATTLGVASAAVASVIESCPISNKSKEENAGCVGSIAAVGASLSAVGSFLAGAAAICARTLNVKALCSEDVTSLVSIMGDIAGVGASMVQTCLRNASDFRNSSASEIAPFIGNGRRLQRLRHRIAPVTVEEEVACVLDGTLVSWELMRASLSIEFAKEGCSANEELSCTSDVSSVITSFSAVGGFLAIMADVCTEVINKDALCAGDVAGTIAITSDLVGTSTSIVETCEPQNTR